MIYPVTIEESKRFFTVLQCGGGRAFTVEEKGVSRNVNTLTLKSVTERGDYVQKMVKVKCTLRVTLNHLYMDAKNINGPREVRHQLSRPLVMTWTVEIDGIRAYLCAVICTFTRSFTVFSLVCRELWLNGSCFIGLLAGPEQFISFALVFIFF